LLLDLVLERLEIRLHLDVIRGVADFAVILHRGIVVMELRGWGVRLQVKLLGALTSTRLRGGGLSEAKALVGVALESDNQREPRRRRRRSR
jgi:hypothetical protein